MKIWWIAFGLASFLVACGKDDNGSSSNNLPENPEDRGDTLAKLDGLAAPDLTGLLYFTSAVSEEPGLFAINPSSPDDTIAVDTELTALVGSPGVFEDIPTIQEYEAHFRPIHVADYDEASQTISNYRIDQVLYADGGILESNGYQRVSTNPTAIPTPVRVSNQMAALPFLFALFRYHLTDSNQTVILHQASNWQIMRVGMSEDEAPLELARNHRVIADFSDSIVAPHGILVHDTGASRLLAMDLTLEMLPEPTLPAQMEGAIEFARAVPVFRNEDGRYLVLSIEGRPAAELFYLDRASMQLIALEDEAEEVFALGEDLTGEPRVPGQLATLPDGFAFIAAQDLISGLISTGFQVLRVRETSVESLYVDEDSESHPSLFEYHDGELFLNRGPEVIAINLDSRQVRVLDTPYEAARRQRIEHVGAGVTGGWLFYNRRYDHLGETIYVATAIDTTSDERIDLYAARWVGTSVASFTSVAGALAEQPVFEVFVFYEDGALAVVDATNPARGAVPLMDLPEATGVRFFGIAPAGHRLAQVIYGDERSGTQEYEVIYVNTRARESGRVVSSGKTSNPNQRPISGF